MTRRALAFFSLLLLAVLALAGPASAHNTLVSSDPEDGAVLEAAPTEVTFVFDRPVPLDTVSVTWVDAAGVRHDLSEIRHGASGETEAVAALPPQAAAGATIRWRLVGPDGHPITGRIQYSVSGATGSTTGAPSTDGGDADTEPWSASEVVRWLLRFTAYIAIAMVGGIVSTSVLVWPDGWTLPLLRRIVAATLVFVALGGVAQLLVVASDISGSAPWSALGDVLSALKTDAGRAFAARVIFAGALGALLFAQTRLDRRARQGITFALFVGLLVTWAYAGHSRSMRYPWAGVPLDVVHHGAVIVWLGGLVVVGLVAARRQEVAELTQSVVRFGSVAGASVAVIVATGVLQTFRLVGSPLELWRADHGRLLLLKVLVLGGMLKIADLNRGRVARHFQSATDARPRAARALARAMVTEFAVGLAVLAVTAAMVVTPPATAERANTAQDQQSIQPRPYASYYHP